MRFSLVRSGPWVLASVTVLGCARPAPRLADLDTPVPPTALKQFLMTTSEGLALGWLAPEEGDTFAIRLAVRSAAGWSAPVTVARAARIADAQMTALGGKSLGVTWLVTSKVGTEADPIEGHDVYLARSSDLGAHWSTPVRGNREASPSMKESPTPGAFPDGRMAVVWSDMRTITFTPPATKDGDWGMQGLTSFIGTTLDTSGVAGPEVVLDNDFCDCCIPAFTASGNELLLAYREHQPNNVREIAVLRWTPTAPSTSTEVSKDGWVLDGCPSRGPAIAEGAGRVGLLWFTGAQGRPKLQLAFSRDGGSVFETPLLLDSLAPEMVAGLQVLENGSAVATWLGTGSAGQEELRVRHIAADGRPGSAVALPAADSTGFVSLSTATRGDSVFVAFAEANGTRPRLVALGGE